MTNDKHNGHDFYIDKNSGYIFLDIEGDYYLYVFMTKSIGRYDRRGFTNQIIDGVLNVGKLTDDETIKHALKLDQLIDFGNIYNNRRKTS